LESSPADIRSWPDNYQVYTASLRECNLVIHLVR
jgi:hypothetical protein